MSEVQRVHTALRVAGYTGTAPAGLVGARTGKALFSHRWGPVFARALAVETRADLVYRPYRSDETDLVPPTPGDEPAEFQPGCDRCGALDTGHVIAQDGTRRLLCTGHRVAEFTTRYAPFDLTREQVQLLVDLYRRWGL